MRIATKLYHLVSTSTRTFHFGRVCRFFLHVSLTYDILCTERSVYHAAKINRRRGGSAHQRAFIENRCHYSAAGIHTGRTAVHERGSRPVGEGCCGLHRNRTQNCLSVTGPNGATVSGACDFPVRPAAAGSPRFDNRIVLLYNKSKL